MPRKSNSRAAQGNGTIRKKTVSRGDKSYTYWEARYTASRDPATGKQIQRSITGKTQKEVSRKLKEITTSIDKGTYIEPSKLTVKEWLDIWLDQYVRGVKPSTHANYAKDINMYIVPYLGHIRLEALTPIKVQAFYNDLTTRITLRHTPLSARSISFIGATLSNALKKAVQINLIPSNPAEHCTKPKIVKREMCYFDSEECKAFVKAISGHSMETLYKVTLFTGMREGEVLGLTWDCIDFNKGTILVNKQLQRTPKQEQPYSLTTTKSGKSRTLTPAPWVMQLLATHKAEQEERRKIAGDLWIDSNFVFTNELGRYLSRSSVYYHFKRIVEGMGCPDMRFHDLRHSYAIASIRAGDDIKTISTNLGHATVAFTMDIYVHCTEEMKKASSDRMEAYINSILNL